MARHEVRDEAGNPTGEFMEFLAEVEIVKVLSACRDLHQSHDRPTLHVHSFVETFITECPKAGDLTNANYFTRASGTELLQPGLHSAADQ